MKILIVDDHATSRKLLRAQLEAEGHGVLEAADGVEALRALEREPVDGVVSDILMPNMDGFRFCLELRKQPKLNAVPFMFYTSTYDSPTDRQLAQTVGADRYIVKPAPVATILEALREAARLGATRRSGREAKSDTSYVLKQYNESLVAKLEERNIELAAHNEALLKAEQQLRLQATALETAANAITITDHRGEILWVNPAFTRLTGYAAEEVIGKTPRVLKSGKHDLAFYRDLWKTILSGQTWHGEFTNRRKDGSLYYGEQIITPVRSEAGTVTRFIGIMHDITERKQAEESQRESERLLRIVIDLVPHFIFAKDAQSRHLFVNRACAEANGLTPEQMVGRSDLDVLGDPHEAETFIRDDQEVIASGRPKTILEGRLTDRTGRTRFLQTTKIPFTAPGTGEPAVLGIAVDITERKQAEEELRETHAQLSHLLEHSPAVIYALKVEGQSVVPYVVSENITELLGFKVPETLHYEWWLGQLHPEDRERAVASVSETLTQGTSLTEYRLRHKDGTYRWVEDKRRLIRGPSNQPKEIVGVWADITERQRAEEILRQASEEETRRGKSSAVKDAVVVLGCGVLVFLLAYLFNLFERPLEFILKHKETPVDEFFGTLLVLSPVLAFFACRRWKDARVVVVEHQRVGQEMRPVPLDEIRLSQPRAFNDMVAVLVLGMLVFGLGYYFNMFEKPLEWIWNNRDTAADEWFGTLIVLSPAFVFFGYRRWRETRMEVLQHQRTPSALRILHGELDKRVQQRTAELVNANKALQAEITERERAEQRIATHHAVTQALAESATLGDTAKKILQIICQTLKWDVGELWTLDRTTRRLRCVEIWHPPSTEFNEFVAISRRTSFAPGEGLPGRVWETGQPAWIAELAQDPNLPRKDLALRVGLRSAIAFPIKLRDEILGVIDFFSAQIRPPDNELLEMFFAAGSQIGQFIERKQIEEQFRQSQKMEAFGQLAGGVAHDFNNILAVIMGYSNLLMESENLTAEMKDQLKQVYSAGERAANLTRQLLTFSRKKEMQISPLNLNEVIGNVTKMLGRIIGEDIKLQCNHASNLPTVQADEGMMEQVLMNLAVNARDAMSKGGQLTITTEGVTTDAAYVQSNAEARAGEFICLSLQDTGCGMTPEIKARIFEPFFTTKGVGKGTGLGLATVFGIVKQHQGWLEVGSQVGVGTTFKVFLPASPRLEAVAERTTADVKARGGNETILLVEDEAALRGLTKIVLQRYGYHVLEAGSGVEARSVWEEHKGRIDLLLTDMIMPEGLTGRELAKQLQARAPSLKVIYVSGYSLDAEGTTFRVREAATFLQKPYHPQKLAQAVRDCLDKT